MPCEGKSKATVTWKWQDEPEKQFESKKCPVNVTLTPVDTTEYLHWLVKNASGVTIYEIFGVEAYLYPNKTYGRVDSPGQYLIEFKQTPTSAFFTAALFNEPVTLEQTPSSGCRIDIYDDKGLAFTETQDKQCPTYKVKCDDDCNEGEMKCECSHYPGYCCIPCNQIASGITSATSTLKGIKS